MDREYADVVRLADVRVDWLDERMDDGLTTNERMDEGINKDGWTLLREFKKGDLCIGS